MQRVVLVSSTASLGFSFKAGEVHAPLWLPADELHPRHPRHPTHAYGLSKKLCEEIGRSFADRGTLDVVVLRPTFIAYPEFKPEIVARARDPDGYPGPCAGGRQPASGGELWHHVDSRDVARPPRSLPNRRSGGCAPTWDTCPKFASRRSTKPIPTHRCMTLRLRGMNSGSRPNTTAGPRSDRTDSATAREERARKLDRRPEFRVAAYANHGCRGRKRSMKQHTDRVALGPVHTIAAHRR